VAESYSLKVVRSSFNEEKQMIVITGKDPKGVINGSVDFRYKYISESGNFMLNDGKYFGSTFKGKMPEYEKTSSPCIRNRGVWTWGHVIYDYRKFIDNMTLLKMNMIVIWNDFVPINMEEVISYAHQNGIKVIFGYSWGWGTDVDISSEEDLNTWTEAALSTYENEYACLNGDGIYFQSFTETTDDKINGTVIAEAVARWVNRIGKRLLMVYPDLEIQFGLHATSVKDRLSYLKEIDDRITIVWEDCGAFPYHYSPKMIGDFEETKKFSSSVSLLRGEQDRFGAVLKGLTCLDWTDFEHQKGSYVLGKASPHVIQRKYELKKEYWHYVKAYWMKNACYALDMIKQIVSDKGNDVTIEALVEDGMLESRIWYPVALLSEMLWDSSLDLNELHFNASLIADL
ncbi:MAG: hypothetical protein JXQ23_08635, partial [Clostridia bacterium]|nr:hypothetical protein [Clostridia bacterium]